ncbi:MAG: transporter [Pseudomonadota bacterium]
MTAGAAPVRAAVAAFGLSLVLPAGAEQGHGHVSVGLQFIHIDGFESTIGELPIGTTDTQTLNVEVDYNLTDRLSVSAGLPLIRKRYQGPGAHDPTAFTPARDSEFVDDGAYHTDLQDFHLGLHYSLDRPGSVLQITPFASYSFPSNDYAFFGHAAVGQNLWKFDLGAAFVYAPHFSDYYLSASPSRVFVEKTLGVNISHWRLDLTAGYFVSPSIAVKLLVLIKEGGGADFPDDFPLPRNTERWFQHDRLVKHNFINAGLGLDWSLSDRYGLSLSALRMVRADQVHVMDYALGAVLTRSF